MNVLNINVGLLGHVDSGKTSIAKCLSTITSTACFDKSPQSQERGITIDLGFSSLIVDIPDKLKAMNENWKKLQFTFVDCPGHASLIKTIIGGVQIIDLMLLVIDINKGIQTQTAECLVIGEMMAKPLVVVLNKIDTIEESKRENVINKVSKKMKLTLANTIFKDSKVIAVAANPGASSNKDPIGIDNLIKLLLETVCVPSRDSEKTTVFAVDHCFSIKGKGTVITGTLLQGTISINDDLEIAQLRLIKKVKSIQMFKQNVEKVKQGDRAGVCVTQFDPKLMERGIACSPGSVKAIYAAIIKINPIKHYKYPLSNKIKYHLTLGYSTVLGKITMFCNNSNDEFLWDLDYEFKDELLVEDFFKMPVFALAEFESPVIAWENSLLIGSKLDIDINSPSCRIAFYSHLVQSIHSKDYIIDVLPNLKIFKCKQKSGTVQRVVNENELIAQSIFKKETNMYPFVNLKVALSTGEEGIIESTFGTSGKVKVRIPTGLMPITMDMFSKKKGKTDDSSLGSKETVSVILKFKKYIFDKDKRIFQI